MQSNEHCTSFFCDLLGHNFANLYAFQHHAHEKKSPVLISTRELSFNHIGVLRSYVIRSFKERGGGQTFSTSFWMRFSQAPLCHYRFKVIFIYIIFLLSGNIIEYICFWRFNSIIMTWNKWLVFTKSVIMGLNNISPWPCPLGDVSLPCVITWHYSTPLLIMRAVGVVVCLSLRMANVPGSRRTQYSEESVIFIAIIVLYFLLFNTQWLIYPFSFHIEILI